MIDIFILPIIISTISRHGVNIKIGINQNIRSGLAKHGEGGGCIHEGAINSDCRRRHSVLLLHKHHIVDPLWVCWNCKNIRPSTSAR